MNFKRDFILTFALAGWFGVYLNFFHPTLAAGTNHDFTVMPVNDKDCVVTGELVLSLETESSQTLASMEQPFQMAGFSSANCVVPFTAPANAGGKCILKATAKPAGKDWEAPTISRLWVAVESAAK